MPKYGILLTMEVRMCFIRRIFNLIPWICTGHRITPNKKWTNQDNSPFVHFVHRSVLFSNHFLTDLERLASILV